MILLTPYIARAELYDLFRSKGSDNKYIDAIWKLREPIAPISRGKWPYASEAGKVAALPTKLRAAGRG